MLRLFHESRSLTVARHICFSMREAGVYAVAEQGGGRWELAQALRWTLLGEIYSHRGWRQTEFGGFGFYGLNPELVLETLLKQYAPMHWPQQG